MMTLSPYRTSRIKRDRRSQGAIQEIRDAIYELLEAEQPMTNRQVFYRLLSLGAIAKTESEYKATVCRLLKQMRLEKQIPFGWIADNTRWMRKPRTYSSMEAALKETARTYRRSIWNEVDAYVEIWLEKDALAGVVSEITYKWDVPLMVTRGYPSLTYIYEAAAAIQSTNKPTYLYYFGDYDPSGVDIPRTVEQGIRKFAPDAEVYFERVAVNPDQIERWDLLTRPTKKSDSRSKNFEGESVEVDAIPPSQIRSLVERCIVQYLDAGELGRIGAVEEAEQNTLSQLAWDFYAHGGAA